MARISFRLPRLVATLFVCTLLSVNTQADAQSPFGRAPQNVRGFLQNPGGTTRAEVGRATNTGRHTVSSVGPMLGNTVAVKPSTNTFRPPTNLGGGPLNTNFKPTLMGNRTQTMNEGGRALINQPATTANQLMRSADRNLRGPAFQRTLVNPTPPMVGPAQIRSDIRNTREVLGTGMTAVGTNVINGTGELGRLNHQTQQDVGRIANQIRRTVTNDHPQIVNPPAGGTAKPTEPQIGNGGSWVIPVQPKPTSVGTGSTVVNPQPNQTANTLNGIANIVGSVAGAVEDAATADEDDMAGGEDEDYIDYIQDQTDVDGYEESISEPAYPPQPVDPTTGDEQPGVNPIVIYNANSGPLNFTVERPDGQPEQITLAGGEMAEVSIEKLVISFSAGENTRRYTLTGGEAYKFSTGKDGLIGLLKLDGQALSSLRGGFLRRQWTYTNQQGYFLQTAPGEWTEYQKGQPKYKFQEVARRFNEVCLFDASRQIEVTLRDGDAPVKRGNATLLTIAGNFTE